MIDLVVVHIHDGKRVDIVTLALRLGAGGFRLLDSGEAERQVRSGRWAVRIVEQRERHPPIRHAAFRVSLDDLLEDFLGGAIPKRVLIAHGAIEATLRHLVARRLEVYATKLLVHIVLRTQRLRCR